jgi:hypothetical protein
MTAIRRGRLRVTAIDAHGIPWLTATLELGAQEAD